MRWRLFGDTRARIERAADTVTARAPELSSAAWAIAALLAAILVALGLVAARG